MGNSASRETDVVVEDSHLGGRYCVPFASSPPRRQNGGNDSEASVAASGEESPLFHSGAENGHDNAEEPSAKRSRRDEEQHHHLGHRYAFPFVSSPPADRTAKISSDNDTRDCDSPVLDSSRRQLMNTNEHSLFPALCSPPCSPEEDGPEEDGPGDDNDMGSKSDSVVDAARQDKDKRRHPLFSLCSPPSSSSSSSSRGSNSIVQGSNQDDDMDKEGADDDLSVHERTRDHPIFSLCSPPSSQEGDSQDSEHSSTGMDSDDRDVDNNERTHPLFSLCSPPSAHNGNSQGSERIGGAEEEGTFDNGSDESSRKHPEHHRALPGADSPPPTRRETALQRQHQQQRGNETTSPLLDTPGKHDHLRFDDEDGSTEFQTPNTTEFQTPDSFGGATKRHLQDSLEKERTTLKDASPVSSVTSEFPVRTKKNAEATNKSTSAATTKPRAASSTRKTKQDTTTKKASTAAVAIKKKSVQAKHLPPSQRRPLKPANSNANKANKTTKKKSTAAMKSTANVGKPSAKSSLGDSIRDKRTPAPANTKAKPALANDDDRDLAVPEEKQHDKYQSNSGFPLTESDDSDDEDFPMPETEKLLVNDTERPSTNGHADAGEDVLMLEANQPSVGDKGRRQSQVKVSSNMLSEPESDDDLPVYIHSTRRPQGTATELLPKNGTGEDDISSDDEDFPMPERNAEHLHALKQGTRHAQERNAIPESEQVVRGTDAVKGKHAAPNKNGTPTDADKPKHTLLLDKYPDYADIAAKLNNPMIFPHRDEPRRRPLPRH